MDIPLLLEELDALGAHLRLEIGVRRGSRGRGAAAVVIFYASSWAEFHAEGLETVAPRTDYKRKIETYHWVMDRQKPTTEKRWLRSRRSQRIELNVPLVVYRARGEGPQFYESTETLVVSAHGALIALTDLVAPWQKLRMQNLNTGENLECRVVSVKKAQIGPPRVAVEFMQATPDFWRIAFPPADWKSAV